MLVFFLTTIYVLPPSHLLSLLDLETKVPSSVLGKDMQEQCSNTDEFHHWPCAYTC
jgi:hypothetical protein